MRVLGSSLKNTAQIERSPLFPDLLVQIIEWNGVDKLRITKSFEDLKTFERNILKRSYGLSTRSKRLPLIYAMGIPPIEVMLHKRRLGLIIRLLRNVLTRPLVKNSIILNRFITQYQLEDKSLEEIDKFCRDMRFKVDKEVKKYMNRS